MALGARFNVGARGTRTTLGIPGSGLSLIEQRAWPKGRRAPAPDDGLMQALLRHGGAPASPPTARAVSLWQGAFRLVLALVFCAFVVRLILGG